MKQVAQEYVDGILEGRAVYEGHSPKPIQAFETLTTIDRYARILGHKVIETINDETTLVVWIDKPLDATAALWLSIQLQQIAIAEYDGTQGRLVGPLAPLWGDFDIERFKL